MKRMAPSISAAEVGPGGERRGLDGNTWVACRYRKPAGGRALRWQRKDRHAQPAVAKTLAVASTFLNKPSSFSEILDACDSRRRRVAPEQRAVQRLSPSLGSYGHCTEKGRRPYQEDRHFAVAWTDDDGRSNHAVAVLDGHGGDATSQLAEEMLPGIIAEQVNGIDLSLPSNVARVNARIVKAFWLFHSYAHGRRHATTGTTATVCLWKTGSNVVWCAYVGDSEALLTVCPGYCRPIELTPQTHKVASDAQETKRIRKMGAHFYNNDSYVSIGKDGSGLAITRSLGDVDSWKGSDPATVKVTDYVVSPVPYVVRAEIPHPRSAVVIASDGLWDFMKLSEACATVATHDDWPLDELACEMAQASLERGSRDNVTVLIFRPHDFE
ncbi:protein phosphatase 2C [Acanthamoeba castellanii medusavirus]|uniref:Protein phosphatase 2C n=1 Tax=Acanthamoeba castellanii medusavirus J1 TaxID=3114988 RepID=A0A3T1CXI3_9VIRU|nr:protein phosphatase 2C [Acanthamoeba castellanii medusavirus]BBI30538.1 protein phosphatase 2C [Acanthamoeba castellanii medusavirus J1]